MIFLYGWPGEITLWMKNAVLTLDVVLIAGDGRISRIVANTTPRSEATISSRGPGRGVLELLAGATQRLAIKPGDRGRLADLAD